MITLTCPCGKRFKVSDQVQGLTADCPRCGEEIDVPIAGGSQPIGWDPKRQPARIERTVTAEPFDTGSTWDEPDEPDATLDSALLQGLSPVVGKTHHDAITTPTVSFGMDVQRTGKVLFTGVNRFLILKVMVIDLGAWVWLLFGIAMFPLLAFLLLPLGWHFGLFLRACRQAVAGDEDRRLVVLQEGAFEDIIRPFGQMIASLWVAFLPLMAYWSFLAISPMDRPTLIIDWVLVGVGLYLWPAAILLLAVTESISALNPLNVIRVATVAFAPYLGVWLILAAVTVAGGLGIQVMVDAAGDNVGGKIFTLYPIIVLFSLTGLAVMRITGLLYPHFKHKLPFAAE